MMTQVQGARRKRYVPFKLKDVFGPLLSQLVFEVKTKKNDTTQKRRLRKIAAPALLPGTFGRWIQAIQKVPLWLGKRLKVTVTSRRITRGITSLSHDVVPKTTLRHAETVQSPLSLCISFLLQELSEQSHSRDHVRQILVSVPRPLLPRFSTPGHPNRILLSSEPSIQRSRKHGHEGSVARWSFGKSPEKMPRLRAAILPLVRIARFLFWFQKIGGLNCRDCCTQ